MVSVNNGLPMTPEEKTLRELKELRTKVNDLDSKMTTVVEKLNYIIGVVNRLDKKN